MIDQTATATVTSTIVFEREVAMEFNQDARAQMLEDNINMYQAPYAAVLREYTSNARDAHRANGYTGAVQVTLPTALAPNLVIRDFGIGMSDKELEQFGQFRVSTKSESNDDIGGFGLGSKSGLAIAPQLTVISVKNGRMNTIIMGRNEHNAPTLGFLEEQETTKPSGTTIIIPTNNGDEFIRAIEQGMFLGWERGSIEIDGQQPEHSVFDPEVVKVDDFGFILPSEWDYSGFVLIHGTHVPHQIPRQYDNLIDHTMATSILTIPNGDVKLLRSREGIISKRSTEEYISTAIHALAERGKELLVEVIESEPTFSAYYKRLHESRNILGGTDGPKYQGKTLLEHMTYPNGTPLLHHSDAIALAEEQNVSANYLIELNLLEHPRLISRNGRKEIQGSADRIMSRAASRTSQGYSNFGGPVIVVNTPRKELPQPTPIINADGTQSDGKLKSPRLPEHNVDLRGTTYAGEMGDYEFFVGSKDDLPEGLRLLATELSKSSPDGTPNTETALDIIDFSEFQERHAKHREKVLTERRATNGTAKTAPKGTYLFGITGTRTTESSNPLRVYTSTHVLDADTGLLTSPDVLLVLVHNPSDTPFQQSKFTPDEKARFDKQFALYADRTAPTILNETLSSPTGDLRTLTFLFIPKSSRSMYLQLKATYETVDLVDIIEERFETMHRTITADIENIPGLTDAEEVAEGMMSDYRAKNFLDSYQFSYRNIDSEQAGTISSLTGASTYVITDPTTLSIQKALQTSGASDDREELRGLTVLLQSVTLLINQLRHLGFTINAASTLGDTGHTPRTLLLRLIGRRIRDRYFMSSYGEVAIPAINIIDSAAPWALEKVTDDPKSLQSAGVYWVSDWQAKEALKG